MDVLRRPAIPEDAVQYQLFLAHPDPSDAEANEKSLKQIMQNILAEIAPLLVPYIWQHHPFNIRYHPEKGKSNTHAHMRARVCVSVRESIISAILFLLVTNVYGSTELLILLCVCKEAFINSSLLFFFILTP